MTIQQPSAQGPFCGNCGLPVDSTRRDCPNCNTTYPNAAPAPAPQPTPAPYPAPAPLPAPRQDTTPDPNAPPPIRLGVGESIWRRYRVTQLRRSASGEGALYVTNVRVIFQGIAHPRGVRRGSVVMQETRVEGITGLSVHRAERVNLSLYIALIFFGIGTLLMLGTGAIPFALVFALITGAIAWRFASGGGRKGTTGVQIHSSASNATPVSLGTFGQATDNHFLRSWIDGPSRFLRELFGMYDALDLLIGFQGPDSDEMIAELGALIYDLQTRGDLARESWKLPPASS